MGKKLGPDLMKSGIPILCSDVNLPEQFRFLSTTKSGTPVFLHERVAEADAIVTISTTQATVRGYGGSGMIIPAVTSNETIEINHLMSLAPDCIPGNNDCLMQRDKYEALEMAGVQMGINVIVSNRGEVIFLNAGTPGSLLSLTPATPSSRPDNVKKIIKNRSGEYGRTRESLPLEGGGKALHHVGCRTMP